MDTTYQTEPRHLTELDLARFDAKLDQRAAELEARMSVRLSQLELQMVRRNATIGFWLLQAATVAIVFVMVILMR